VKQQRHPQILQQAKGHCSLSLFNFSRPQVSSINTQLNHLLAWQVPKVLISTPKKDGKGDSGSEDNGASKDKGYPLFDRQLK
jgi:hypothetical protein